ncbi:MAG: sugar phosphate nucleotidyltransferase [Candidatus Saccharimonadales bacterium]
MITIIIAGGSGSRLWPLSTPVKPKQFLVIDDSGKSLLQKTYQRVRDLSDKVYVVTSESIADVTCKQLPEIIDNIIVEPSRKGVANALYLGIRRVLKDGYTKSEPIFVLWSDHLIRDQDTFEQTVRDAQAAVQNGAKLVQFGIVPEYPTTNLGYIKKGERQHGSNVYAIDSWKYLPDQETANKWLESGDYLWNAGYFVSTIDYILTEIERESPESFKEFLAINEVSDDNLVEVYNEQEGAILDHVLSEKMQGAHVVACTFDWVDIGNFLDLHAVSRHGESGNTIQGDVLTHNVNDSFVVNKLEMPVSVIGLDHVAVVATPDGIVVVNKSQSKAVGDIAKRIQDR